MRFSSAALPGCADGSCKKYFRERVDPAVAGSSSLQERGFATRYDTGRPPLPITTSPGDTPMRFMMLMIPKGYESAAAGTLPSAEAVEAMMAYNRELQEAGVLIALDGLHPPSMGARVSFAGGKPKITDGPFPEAKEVLGGYWMIDVASREEAIAWATRCPGSDNETIEVRQVQEMEDFPEDVQQAAAGFEQLQNRGILSPIPSL
ncbi:YciI family protein [Lysobacter sp. ESA13C]|uniref:YciI family protein n=1 Tax=Lysobacter sp. ESA13C TaxID=2862676 RepID=UPI001CBC781B|nr:YciI family protein [Lysobacter sp. ESA13C]